MQTGRTALTLAAIKGYEVVVNTLLDNKSVPGIRDMKGHLALHYACMQGHEQIVKELVKENMELAVGERVILMGTIMCDDQNLHL